MPFINYVSKKFTSDHQQVIDRTNDIINSYDERGYDLTLRQVYYQFVSRAWIPNDDKQYKRLGSIISEARRAGLIDWNKIIDRTRYVRNPSFWSSPASLVGSCANQFDVDWWSNQEYRPEVWVEKDALVGVLEVACQPWNCPYFSCRGYTSDSEIWSAAQRMRNHVREGKTPIVFHLGDHDPSGIDMSRDIADRLKLFSRSDIEVKRIALNMDQIETYNPPPNPAKTSDVRYQGYQEQYGDESWELDALNPETITELIATEMRLIVDQVAWDESERERDEGCELLSKVSKNWIDLTEWLKDLPQDEETSN